MITKLANFKAWLNCGSTGKLTFLPGAIRIEEIRGMEVLNMHTNQIEKIYTNV
jgi:hypothetical protein